jgi:isoquinoline 1-oxidoreductase alpha subunit
MARMIVNGEAVHYRLDPQTPLLWALRDASNLTGTKYGCDSRDCGACTVIVDGQAAMSCAVPIGELEGSRVTTIEGLGGRHPVQQAWVAERVTQCGFCEPGFIMALTALVDSGRSVGAVEIDSIPNHCRCCAYPRIRKAAERAVRSAAAPAQADEQ